MQNPFADLIPQQANQPQVVNVPQQQQANPFADLIPQQKVERGTSEGSQQQEPSIMDRAMVSLLHQQSPLGPTKNYDPEANNLNLLEKVGNTAVDFLPYQLGAAGLMKLPALAKFAASSPFLASMLENTASGAAYGGVNNGSGGAVVGGIAGAVSPVLSKPLEWGMQYGAKKLAQSSIPALIDKATSKVGQLLDPNDYAQNLYGKFLSKFTQNKSNWKDLNQTAQGIDQSLVKPQISDPNFINAKSSGGSYQAEIPSLEQTVSPNKVISGYDAGGAPIFGYTPETKSISSPSSSNMIATGQYDASGAPIMTNKIQFNASPYHDYIDAFKNKVNAMEPAQQQEYKQALMLADQASEIGPQSFSGMVSSRKNINSDMKDFLKQQGIDSMNSRSQEFLSGLKKTLKGDTALANQGNVGDTAFSDFMNKWEGANQSYQDLQNFYKSPQASTGVVKPIRQTREMYDNALKTGVMDGSIIGKYAPRPSQTGTQGLDQLANNMGSKQAAQDAMKAYINRKALGNGNTTLDVAAEYGKLSPAQRDWIYGASPEGDMLKAINDTRLAFGKEPEKSFYKMISHPYFHMIAAPAIGGTIGAYAGGKKGAGVGIAAPLIASSLMKGAGSRLSPEVVQGLIRYAQSAHQGPARVVNTLLQPIVNNGGQQQ